MSLKFISDDIMECVGYCDIPLSNVITSQNHLVDRWYPFTADMKSGIKVGEIRLIIQYISNPSVESDDDVDKNEIFKSLNESSVNNYLCINVKKGIRIIDRTFNGLLHPVYI